MIRARLLGIRLLTIDATVVLGPADLAAPSVAAHDPPQRASVRRRNFAEPVSRHRTAVGRGCSEHHPGMEPRPHAARPLLSHRPSADACARHMSPRSRARRSPPNVQSHRDVRLGTHARSRGPRSARTLGSSARRCLRGPSGATADRRLRHGRLVPSAGPHRSVAAYRLRTRVSCVASSSADGEPRSVIYKPGIPSPSLASTSCGWRPNFSSKPEWAGSTWSGSSCSAWSTWSYSPCSRSRSRILSLGLP